MKTPNIRVLVAEDSPTARALLVGMISASSGLEVCGQATNGLDAVEFTKSLRPDVVTMDIQMPGLDGFEARHLDIHCDYVGAKALRELDSVEAIGRLPADLEPA